jgi:hypothetical protein
MRRLVRVLPSFAVLAAGCGSPNPPLPPASEIESMQALVSKDEARFTVPREHWQPIFDALLPATRDRNPSKWQVLGELEVVTRGGERRTVWLYQLGQGPGAFAVGEDWDRRVYYRGGETAELREALEAARKASSGR